MLISNKPVENVNKISRIILSFNWLNLISDEKYLHNDRLVVVVKVKNDN